MKTFEITVAYQAWTTVQVVAENEDMARAIALNVVGEDPPNNFEVTDVSVDEVANA